MIPSIVQGKVAHIPAIIARVRPADVAELWDFACVTPEQAMYYGLNMSRIVKTGLVDDVPVCIFGVTTVSAVASVGRPWMIGTDLLDKYSKVFLRRCAPVVDEMLEAYNRLENYVDVRNVRAIAWLRWLGFTMEEPRRMGPYHHMFIPFYKEAL